MSDSVGVPDRAGDREIEPVFVRGEKNAAGFAQEIFEPIEFLTGQF